MGAHRCMGGSRAQPQRRGQRRPTARIAGDRSYARGWCRHLSILSQGSLPNRNFAYYCSPLYSHLRLGIHLIPLFRQSSCSHLRSPISALLLSSSIGNSPNSPISAIPFALIFDWDFTYCPYWLRSNSLGSNMVGSKSSLRECSSISPRHGALKIQRGTTS